MTARTDGNHEASARDQVLADGLVDWVELERVHDHVAREHAEDALQVILQNTLELIRSLVSDGWCELGELDADSRFVMWQRPLDESIRAIHHVYVDGFDDADTWRWFCWLNLTDRGKQAADVVVRKMSGSDSGQAVAAKEAEQRRLMMASSLVDAIAGHVDSLRQVPPGHLPDWSAVRGPQPAGRSDVAETVSFFTFTGKPPAAVIYENSDRTFTELNTSLGDANRIVGAPRTEVLATPADTEMLAVRSSGYVVLNSRWVWAQIGTYVVGSDTPDEGRLLAHCVYVDAALRDELHDDVVARTDSVYRAFQQAYA